MPIETEIKFRVTDLSALAERLESAGFRMETPRSFESNTLYDTPDRQLRARTEILRIRSYAGHWTLTHKRLPGPSGSGPGHPNSDRHKHRVETETSVEHGGALAELFSLSALSPPSAMKNGVPSGPTARATASSMKRPSATTPSSKALPIGSTAPPSVLALIPPNTLLSATAASLTSGVSSTAALSKNSPFPPSPPLPDKADGHAFPASQVFALTHGGELVFLRSPF